MASTTKQPPSAHWTSYEPWDYDGLKERLEGFMQNINKSALVNHVHHITGKSAVMSDPFSAGQFWCCFELVLQDQSLIVARVRLPRHPESNERVDDESELYAIECEVATMQFLQENVTGVPCPRLHAYEPPRSQRAVDVGACYMLIEGFYGNTLQDVKFDICDLPISTQENIIAQWASVQAELASFSFPSIGSIASYSGDRDPSIGKLSVAVAEGFRNAGPFTSALDYYSAVGEARYLEARNAVAGDKDRSPFAVLGPFIFRDIVRNTELFKDSDGDTQFHLNHMDMGTQNILVDEDFNFLAIIDWEFAQTAPWTVNHYPMPFPLVTSDAQIELVLKDPEHVGHQNLSRQSRARSIYEQKFRDAEQALRDRGKPLRRSIAAVLNGPASRIYAALETIGDFGGRDEEITYEMVRLAFGLEGEDIEKYVRRLEKEMKEMEAKSA